jgi:hypothetical protein
MTNNRVLVTGAIGAAGGATSRILGPIRTLATENLWRGEHTELVYA